MAVGYRGNSNNYNANTASYTVAKPTGLAAQDLLFACLVTGATGAITPSDAGWTTLLTDATYLGILLVYKIVGASEPASYTFTTAAATNWIHSADAFTGCDQTTPIDGSGLQDNAASTAVTAPSVNVTGAGEALLWLGILPSTQGITIPGGYIQNADRYDTAKHIKSARLLAPAAGASGAVAGSTTPAINNVGILVSIAPPGVLGRGSAPIYPVIHLGRGHRGPHRLR